MAGDGVVLVVEDDADVREAILELLQDEDVATAQASNGQEALDILKDGRVRPSVILLDLMMPILDGWGFRARQLEDPELAAIPVVVLSAQRSSVAPAEKSFDAMLTKPVRASVLMDVLRRYLGSAV